MKNLDQLTYECINELFTIGITPGNVIAVTNESRSKRRNGQCRKKGKMYTINISDKLLTGKVSEKDIKNTIMHELLHTLPNCMNHGNEWKKQAEIVNNSLGYNIKRCNDLEGFEHDEYRYMFKCNDCGQEFGRYKKSRFTENYTAYRCKCGGKINRIK